MPVSRRSVLSIVVLGLLAVFVGIGFWYESRQKTPSEADDMTAIAVTSGADRGPGSLREALFIAAAAKGPSTISLRVPKITLSTALPPLVTTHGLDLVPQEGGVEIDGAALPSGPVLDVASANVNIEGLTLVGCKASGVLLRAAQFRLQASTFRSCDVGVDVAENVNEALIERNAFVNNRVGVRLAGAARNVSVLKNDFKEQRDAGIWAVRADADARGTPISIRENRFTNERIGILLVNVSAALERNELLASGEAAIQVMGAGAVVRGNRISGGAAMGIVAESSRGAVIEDNEIDGLQAYGVMLKSSADALLQRNRVHSSGYGFAFVLGESPSTAVDNTIIEPKFNGIDVIGDSPVLRGNNVMRPHALALKVVDFKAPDGRTVPSQPFLEGNNFNAQGLVVASGDATFSEARQRSE